MEVKENGGNLVVLVKTTTTTTITDAPFSSQIAHTRLSFRRAKARERVGLGKMSKGEGNDSR